MLLHPHPQPYPYNPNNVSYVVAGHQWLATKAQASTLQNKKWAIRSKITGEARQQQLKQQQQQQQNEQEQLQYVQIGEHKNPFVNMNEMRPQFQVWRRQHSCLQSYQAAFLPHRVYRLKV